MVVNDGQWWLRSTLMCGVPPLNMTLWAPHAAAGLFKAIHQALALPACHGRAPGVTPSIPFPNNTHRIHVDKSDDAGFVIRGGCICVARKNHKMMSNDMKYRIEDANSI